TSNETGSEATFPGESEPVSLEVAPDETSSQEWERIEKEGQRWVKSRVGEFVPKLVSSKPSSFFRLLFADQKTVVSSLLAKMLPEGKRFKLEPRAPGSELDEVVRGPVLGIGTRGVVFEGTMVSSGEKFAMKMQYVQKGFFGQWPTRKEMVKEMQQELAVADILKHAYGPEGVLSKGLVLPVETRRIRGYGEFITHPFTRTLLWNNITIFPVMKCTLADLVKIPNWPREARLYVSKRLLEIIAAVHENGVVHSDIHEGNVLLKKGSGDVFFGDFYNRRGISTMRAEGGENKR
ncbi:protein kinase (incomplete catalytic triad), partial [Cystoisospora suis]